MNLNELQDQIIAQAKNFGASLAGIARVEDLKRSPSYAQYEQNPYYDFLEPIPEWPEDAISILVFALAHPKSEPELDWWDPRPGGTPGNRILIQIQKKMKSWLNDELNINARSLPYQLERGGIFLKDASVLAGIGIIGKNNLLLTPEYGPRIRLRAMFLDVDLETTKALDFDPCSNCDLPCFWACPQNAFRRGSYQREYCQVQMKINEDNIQPLSNDPEIVHVRYCRACEYACPVAH
jgi:epoxyqueuosine reductase